MKLKQINLAPEVKLYYINEKPDMDLAKKVSRIFDGSLKPFKEMPRHEVYTVEYGNNIYYAKKFFPTTFEQKISYCIRESKALSCLILFDRLVNANLKVIKAVFALSYQKGLKHESILVTEKTDGMSLREALIGNISSSEKEEIMLRFLATLGDFYRNKFIHKDPVLANFFVDLNKNPSEIIFIDLDAIAIGHWLPQKRVFYSLNKLVLSIYSNLGNRNSDKGFSREQVVFYVEQFLKSYNSSLKVDTALRYLTQGTVKLFQNPQKYPGRAKHKALLSIMKNWNA